ARPLPRWSRDTPWCRCPRRAAVRRSDVRMRRGRPRAGACSRPWPARVSGAPGLEPGTRLDSRPPDCRLTLVHLAPGRVRIVDGHLSGRGVGSWPQIFFTHGAVLVDHEGHDTGDVVLRRPGHECEPSGQLAFDDVAPGAARGDSPLPGQDPEVVAMK